MGATVFFICGIASLLVAADEGRKSNKNGAWVMVITVVGMALIGIALWMVE